MFETFCRKTKFVRAGMTAAVATTLVACGPQEQAYVEMLGNDTTAVEVFTRSADSLDGRLLIRMPVTRVAHYSGAIDADGHIARLDVVWSTPPENPEGPGEERFSISFEDNGATVERTTEDGERSTVVAVSGEGLPLIGKSPWSYAILEEAVRRSVAEGADSLPLTVVSGQSGRGTGNQLVRVGPETFSYSYFGFPMMVMADAEGRVVGVSGAQTTNQVEGAMTTGVDFEALAADFAARDAAGEGLGVASPPGTVEATIAGASLRVEYSRPAKRGRDIWGGLVPYDEVWRTGANSATHFTTDRDLMLGDTRIPAGTYTLWSIYTANSARLIVNRQTQQWGTQYDADRDLARIDMERRPLDEPAERFTIRIESTEGGGELRLEWDQTQFVVPIRAS